MKHLIGALFLLASSAAYAAPQNLICSVKSNGQGFVSPQLALSYEPGQRSGAVYDVYIALVHEQPIAARVKTRANGDVEFKWRVNIPANPDRAQVSYTAVLTPKTKAVRVRGKIRHATNFVGGQGACRSGGF